MRTSETQKEFSKLLDRFFIEKECSNNEVFMYLGSEVISFFLSCGFHENETNEMLDYLKNQLQQYKEKKIDK